MPSSSEERVLSNLIKHMKRVEDDPLTPLIDTYYLKRDRAKRRLRRYEINMEDRPRPFGRLSPSKICGCERQAAFAFVGMPGRKVVDPEQQGIFEDGNWRHHRWQATFRDMECVLGRKVFRVHSIEEAVEHDPLYVAGHLDACVSIHGMKWIIDFKGINSWGFERVFRQHEPHPEHVLQLMAYMRARRVRRGILLYEHKDKNLTKAFVVRFTGKQWQEVNLWCNTVIKKIRNEDLPPMALGCQAGQFLFEKCPWSYVCYGEHNDEQIRKRMYRDFPGVEEAWEEGKRIVAEFAGRID